VIPPDAAGPGVPSHPIVIQRPDQSLPGQQPVVDNTLPPGQPMPSHPIVLPPVPPPEEGTKALVLVITKNNEPVWFIIDKNGGLKPTHPQPKPGGQQGQQGGQQGQPPRS
jgi:hypothetical protein